MSSSAAGDAICPAMCGRVHLLSDVEKLIEVFSIPPSRPAPNIAASWNVAPTDPLPVVRYNGRAGERSLDVLRWGLVPFWAKDIKVGFANINAKAEGIDTRPAFREAFQRRRCLVPVDNFFEWEKTGIGKQPYAIALPIAESWRSRAYGRTGVLRPASGFAQLCDRHHPCRTNYAPKFTTACLWCSNRKYGRPGSARNPPTTRSQGDAGPLPVR